jgi:hypothetical protein
MSAAGRLCADLDHTLLSLRLSQAVKQLVRPVQQGLLCVDAVEKHG